MKQNTKQYPAVLDPSRVGTYDPLAKAGGGYVWDEVLEYRAWCNPIRGAPVEAAGDPYYHAFATYEEALTFSRRTKGAEVPLALILQRESILEPKPGQYRHMKKERVTEWQVAWLERPRRGPTTIPDFLASHSKRQRGAVPR